MLWLCAGAALAQSVSVAGDHDDLKDTLTAAARVLSLEEGATRGDAIAAAQGDYQRLIAVLYAEGYFGPTVSISLAGREAADLSILRPPAVIQPVQIRVDPGPRFRFGQATVSPLPDGTLLPETFRKGRTARTARIRSAAQAGVEAWQNASHAKARVAGSQITARHDERRLDVAVQIEPGPALRFGRLVVPGNSAVRAERLRKIAGLPEGEPFHPERLRRTSQRLVETGAFRSVVVEEAEQPNPDGTLDYTLSVQDATPRRIGFGAEMSSAEGLSVEAFWMHRNIFGGAERLRFDLDIDGIGGGSGGEDYRLGVTLAVPGFRRPDDTLTYSLLAERLNEPTYDSRIFEASIRRSRRIDERLSAYLGAGLRTSRTRDAFGARSFRHLTFDAGGIWDARDDQLTPRGGHYVGLGLRPFIGLQDSESGFRLTSDLRAYRALGERTVLAGRLQLGAVLGPSLEDTPPEFLFLSGGGGTVRGQEFQSLSISLPQGAVGGRSFVGLSAELRRDLGNNLGLNAFLDYGYIAAGSDFRSGKDHVGIGIGARYQTSLGAVRIDLATQANGDSFSDPFLYIGLGEAF